MPLFKKAICFFIPLLFFSCHGGDKYKLAAYGEHLEKIVKTEEGIFRGLYLGMALKNVKEKETIGLSDEDSSYLYYEIPLDSSNSFTLAYDFDEKGLKEIQSDVFMKNEDQFNELLNKFKMYFDDKYGKAENANGFWVWAKKAEKEDNIKITLTDESSDFQYNKLSLNVYNADY